MKKFIILSHIVVLIAGFGLGRYFSKTTIQADIPTDIVKTVAHVPVNDELFEHLWSDAESDVAYYRYIGERDLVNIGDTVHFYDGVEGTIQSVSINGFTVTAEESIIMGYSGSAVLSKENIQIGYVSEEIDTKVIYCIWT